MLVEQHIYSVVCDADGCYESLEGYGSERNVFDDALVEGWHICRGFSESHLCPEHAEER